MLRTHHATKRKTAAQLDREIAQAMYDNPSEDTGSGASFRTAGTKVIIEPTPAYRSKRGQGIVHKTRKTGVLMEDANIGPGAGWDVYDVRLLDGTETSAYGFDLRAAPSTLARAAAGGKRSHATRGSVLYVVTVPPTREVGSYKTKVRGPMDNARRDALWDYNSARRHDGLPPVDRMPPGTKYTKET